MSSIEKSKLLIEQEQRIKVLNKDITKVKKVIKSLKTRLSKTQAHFEQTQRDIFHKTTSAMEAFMEKTTSVLNWLEKILKNKKLPLFYREMINMLSEEMKDQLNVEELQQQFEVPEEFKDGKAEKRDIFETFRVEPKKNEKKNIRQLYLQLSKQFHPDKASSEEETERFKTIQQQLVQAYQTNDLYALEELKIWHGLMDDPGEETNTDVLQQQIEQRERQLADLVAQKERLSEELKRFRKSDMGKMLTDFDTMTRRGDSPLDSLEHVNHVLKDFDAMIELLKEVDKTNRFDLLDDLVPMPDEEEELDSFDSFMDMILGDDDFDDDEGFYDEDSERLAIEENTNAKFKLGSWVNIHWDKEYLMNYFELRRLKSKVNFPLSGQVISSVFHPFTGDPIYVVSLDTSSLKALPKQALEVAIERNGFGTLTVLEEDLTKGKKPKAASLKNGTKEYNEIWSKYAFSDEPQEVREYIKKMIQSDEKEPQNLIVDRFLKEKISAYTHIVTSDYQYQFRSQKPVKAEVHYQDFDPAVGFVVKLKKGKRSFDVPLAELMVSMEDYPELYCLIEAFETWEYAYLESYVEERVMS